jgi:lysophospholipase L1-like esterase
VRWTVEHSILAGKLQRAFWRLQASTVDPAEAIREFHPPLVGWPFVEHSYRRLAELAAARGLPVLLLDFPSLAETAAFGTDDYSERLDRLGSELGWPVIHVAPAWGDASSQLAWPEDLLHPNAVGHERAARHIAAEVVGRTLLK